jgi:hypothetical protein
VPQAEIFREELLNDLKARPPKYIVSVGPVEGFKRFGGIYSFIKAKYILEKQFRDDRYVYGYRG